MAKKKVTTAKKKAAKKVAAKAVKKSAKPAAKKKASVKKSAKKAAKKTAKKKAAPAPVAKPVAAKKKATPAPVAAKPVVAKPVDTKKDSKANKAAAKKDPAKPALTNEELLDELGRPQLSADTFLDRIFEHDMKARQAFEFLEIHTLRELEALDPNDLISKLTSPTIQTVGRIRGGLAMLNRHLKGDEKFTKQFQDRVKREQKSNR